MLNKKEQKLLLDFLDRLDNYLSNEGCNDWEFPSNWSKTEKTKFVNEFHKLNNSMDEFNEDYLTLPDFCILAVLKKKLKQTFKESNKVKILEQNGVTVEIMDL